MNRGFDCCGAAGGRRVMPERRAAAARARAGRGSPKAASPGRTIPSPAGLLLGTLGRLAWPRLRTRRRCWTAGLGPRGRGSGFRRVALAWFRAHRTFSIGRFAERPACYGFNTPPHGGASPTKITPATGRRRTEPVAPPPAEALKKSFLSGWRSVGSPGLAPVSTAVRPPPLGDTSRRPPASARCRPRESARCWLRCRPSSPWPCQSGQHRPLP